MSEDNLPPEDLPGNESSPDNLPEVEGSSGDQQIQGTKVSLDKRLIIGASVVAILFVLLAILLMLPRLSGSIRTQVLTNSSTPSLPVRSLSPSATPSVTPSPSPIQVQITINVDPIEVQEGDDGDRNVVGAWAEMSPANPCEGDIVVQLERNPGGGIGNFPEVATIGQDYEDFTAGELLGEIKIPPNASSSEDHLRKDVIDIFIIGDIDPEFDEVFPVDIDRVIEPTHCLLEEETEGAEVIIRDDDWAQPSSTPTPFV